MIDKKIVYTILITSFLLVSINVSAQTQEIQKPAWAQKNKYADYSYTEDLVIENQQSGEINVYRASGYLKWEVTEVLDNRAIVKITSNNTWENNKIPPNATSKTGKNEQEENFYYEQNSYFYLKPTTLQNFKNDNLPPILENLFKGAKNIEVKYGNLKTLHVHQSNQNPTFTTTRDLYYSYDTGILAKGVLKNNSTTYTDQTIYNLKDTNLENNATNSEKKPTNPLLQSKWMYISIGIIIAIVAIGVTTIKLQ